MYTAEQWLADLEAKAAEASLAEKTGIGMRLVGYC